METLGRQLIVQKVKLLIDVPESLQFKRKQNINRLNVSSKKTNIESQNKLISNLKEII